MKSGFLQKSLFWVIVNQIILSIGALAIVVILSFFLDPETFGGIRFLASILAVFAFFSLPGIGPLIMQDTVTLSRQRFVHTLVTQAYWGLGSTIGGIILFVIFMFRGNNDLAYAFIIGSILSPVANLYLMPGLVLAGLKRFKAKTIVDLIIMLCILSGAAFGAWLTKSIAGTIFFYFGIQSLITLISLVIVMRKLPVHDTHAAAQDQQSNIQYGKQLTLFQIPFTFLPSLEKVIIYLILGPAALAVFVIATIPTEHARNALRNVFQFYMLPHMEKEHGFYHFKKWFFISAGMTLVSMAALVVFILFFLPILFPYYQHVSYLGLLLIFALIPLPMQVFTLSWISLRRTQALLTYSSAFVVVNAVLFFSGSLLFGLKGAIVAKIVVEFLGIILILILHKKSP